MNKRIIEERTGRKWIETAVYTDAAEVYNSLSHDLIGKKLNKCTWIKSIKKTPLYNGTDKIVVDYGNGTRSIYIVETH